MITWIGIQELLIRDGDEISCDGKGTVSSLIIEGPYELCRDKGPQLGQTISGYPGYVVSTRLQRGPGGTGQIHVNLRAERQEDTKSIKYEPEYSVHMATESLDLETHPRYAKDEGINIKFGIKLEDEITYNKDALPEKWKKVFEAVFGSEINEIKTTVGAALQRAKGASLDERELLGSHSNRVQNVSKLFEDFFKKYSAGTRQYSLSYPILRRTTEWFGSIQGWRGRIQYIATNEVSDFESLLPSAPQSGKKWEYLKVADDVDRHGVRGRIRRTEEYRGALAWDTDIYPK